MKKTSAIIILIVIFITGCTKNDFQHIDTNDESKAASDSLRIDMILNENDYFNEGTQLSLDSFKELNRDIEIKSNYIPASEYLYRLKINLASDNAPDVFSWYPGYSVKHLIDKGMVADLTTALEKDPQWYNSFAKGIWKYTTFNDKIYGTPCGAAYVSLFANTDILQTYNLKVPKTYSELKECVIVLRNNGITPIAFNTTEDGLLLYYAIVSILSGRSYETVYHEESVNKQYFIDAANHLKELYNLGAFPKDLYTLTNSSRNHMFINKEAAFIIRKSDFIGEIYRHSKYQPSGLYDPADTSVSSVLFPWFESSKSNPNAAIYGVSQNCYYISQKSMDNASVYNTCLSFLKYMSSKNVAELFLESTTPVTIIKNMESSEFYYNSLLVSARTTFYSNANQLVVLPETNKYYENIKSLTNHIISLFNGIETADEIFSNHIEGIYDEK